MLPAAAISTLMPLLRMLDAEKAHHLTLRALTMGLVGTQTGRDDTALQVRALGCLFPNPIGLAAGFDKNAEAVMPLMRLGFGFVEAGTVTPRAQPGNSRPRLFRLPRDRAVINRMGFNNAGIDAYTARLKLLGPRPCPFGANVGINKDGADPERDYPALVAALSPFADYVVINVSSPNTLACETCRVRARLVRSAGGRGASAGAPTDIGENCPRSFGCRPKAVVETDHFGGSRADHRQYDDRTSPGTGRAQRWAGRRPFGRAAVCSFHRNARTRVPAGRKPPDPDWLRRCAHRERCIGKIASRRLPGATLHRSSPTPARRSSRA